ncbi:Phosphatidylinositol 4-kinase pik1alpha (PI4-kinase)(PtdIns-4-kinase) [Coniothyrium glycines]
MSWNLLERFIESDHFNTDPSLAVAYLARYADHVGIHYVLCSKLRQFAYEELEFFLPQLCHLLISIDNESMALEEFIIDLCEESVNGALLTFWLFQTYLHDLASAPNSNAFKTCRRIYNRVQRIVFGSTEPVRREKIKENILPVSVLSSLVLATIAAPFLPLHAGPLAIAQARKPRPLEDIISDNVQTAKVGRSKTVAAASPRIRQKRATQGYSDPEDERVSKSAAPRPREPRDPKDLRRQAARPPNPPRTPSAQHRPTLLSIAHEARLSSSSLPEFRDGRTSPLPTPPPTAGLGPKPDHHGSRKHISNPPRPLTPTALSRTQKVRLLRANYFRTETQFLSALEDISSRLVSVPKPARLSALRAELALITQDLPAEVDIPVLSPPTLRNGIASQSQHHRIVRINPAEATSLNSAEKVPYLLMVEVLQEDFNFDPDTEQNQELLERLMLEKGTSRRRLFDITNAEYLAFDRTPPNGSDSVFEPATGDLGSTSLIQSNNEDDISSGMARVALSNPIANGKVPPPRSSSGANTLSSMVTLSTPRTSDSQISRSNSPAPAMRRMTIPASMNRGTQSADQPDFSALATHMRTAAQMLAQLEASGAKRPKGEVAAIKAKIIASMQSLEEQNFLPEEQGPTFATIMAESDPTAITVEPEDLEDGMAVATNSGAGAARMENDLKTAGMRRKGDRDDPSAATFGEEWSAKRERIRRSSPYGQLKNWDLISVIVKTGDDLRQEAFACQLIEVCTKIWEEANVPVWTKRMRILVTGESCGLIETITNGVSLHSLKRSLTLASIAAGTNPKKRIATLKDHWLKTFGEPESEAYVAGVGAFIRSLAAYSVISYVLQLKDRHNGNLLIDNMGHIIHIDFGFMLSNSPGSMGFEAAPFKLTQEYVDVLGGLTSTGFEEFKTLCKKAFQALRKDADRLIMLVDLMSKQSKMPCFAAGAASVTNSLRARMMLHLSKEEAETFVEELIAKSVGSYYTRLYDTFQYRTQGIY